jgi:hypothetical protein
MSDDSAENNKIHIHLEGNDFEGFSLRMASVVVFSVGLTWLTGWDGGLIFVLIALCWLSFFGYKIISFKERAYSQIIHDLETRNAKLEKSNQLLQNVVQDSLGMRISMEEE